MRRFSNQRQLQIVSEISVIPLMDLVLVLLLALLLAMPLLKGDKSLLPAVKSAPAPNVPPPVDVVTLTMNRDLSVTLNGAMLARTDLPTSLKQLMQRQPDTGVEVRMHRDLPVSELMGTMKMLEDAGVRKTAVTTHTDEP